MSVVSSASFEVSIQHKSHPRSRTKRASLCSTPKAPGSSSARLPTSAIIGTRSGGVTTRHSIAYAHPTPDDPQKTRAPTVEACLTISNWLCSPSATMYSATSWPLAIFLAIACMTVSYGRIGYAVTTSRSARASASATASLPEIRSSLSSPAAAGLGVVTVAMSSPYTVLWAAFSPGIPAVISLPPVSRSRFSSSSYWPRKRKPCERTVAFLSPIFSVSHVLYAALSARHISHWLSLSSKTASFTMVMQFSTGQTASHTPQPQHASIAASNVPSGITSKTESGHEIQHRLHFTQVSKSITGRMVRVVYFLKYGLRSGTCPLSASLGLPTG